MARRTRQLEFRPALDTAQELIGVLQRILATDQDQLRLEVTPSGKVTKVMLIPGDQ